MSAPGLHRWVRGVLAGLLLVSGAAGVSGQQATKVRAVLFYSPTCPHCHQVMTVDLPPLIREYGDRLQIVAVSTATATGARMYQAVVDALEIPEERLGVPTLLLGSTVLVGSGEIPAQLPGLVRQGLAGAGVDWPAIAAVRLQLQAQGLIEEPVPVQPAVPPARVAADSPAPAAGGALGGATGAAQAVTPRPASPSPGAEPGRAELKPAQSPPGSVSSAPESSDTTSATGAPGAVTLPASSDSAAGGLLDLTGAADDADALDRFRVDPVGNSVAVAVLFGMLLALGAVAAAVSGRLSWRALPEWLTPVLSLVGVGVAFYLAFVEVTGATAVCGPVGDCNTVQQSEYAWVAGIIPVGLMGVVGYVLLLAVWVVAVAGPARHGRLARVLLWGSALLGTVFSVYLTFLEPFVIGATCAWCITSALVMTLLLLQATPGALAVRDGRSGGRR